MRYRAGVLAAAIFCGATALAAGEVEDRIVKRFDDYKAALQGDRGAEAAAFLSRSTVDYYEKVRDLALYATREELKPQSHVDVLQAMVLRSRIPAAEMRLMDGRALLVRAIDNGWVGKENFEPFSVAAVRVDGDKAVADMAPAAGTPTTPLDFVREGGEWLIDLVGLLQSTNQMFDMLITTQQLDREAFVLTVLSSLDGKPVDATVWNPPLSKPVEK